MPPEMLTYRWFAENYHWTPDQVRELDLDEYTWLPITQAGLQEAQRVEQEREARMAKKQPQR